MRNRGSDGGGPDRSNTSLVWAGAVQNRIRTSSGPGLGARGGVLAASRPGAAPRSMAAPRAKTERPVQNPRFRDRGPGLVFAWKGNVFNRSRSSFRVHCQELRRIASLDEEDDGLLRALRLRLVDGRVVIVDVFDLRVVHFLDDVSALHAGVIRGTPLPDVGDDHPGLVADAVLLCEVTGQRLDRQSQDLRGRRGPLADRLFVRPFPEPHPEVARLPVPEHVHPDSLVDRRIRHQEAEILNVGYLPAVEFGDHVLYEEPGAVR